MVSLLHAWAAAAEAGEAEAEAEAEAEESTLRRDADVRVLYFTLTRMPHTGSGAWGVYPAGPLRAAAQAFFQHHGGGQRLGWFIAWASTRMSDSCLLEPL